MKTMNSFGLFCFVLVAITTILTAPMSAQAGKMEECIIKYASVSQFMYSPQVEDKGNGRFHLESRFERGHGEDIYFSPGDLKKIENWCNTGQSVEAYRAYESQFSALSRVLHAGMPPMGTGSFLVDNDYQRECRQ